MQRFVPLFAFLSLIVPAYAQALGTHFIEAERLADGRTLMVDAGDKSAVLGAILMVDADGTLHHSWQRAFHYPHSAEFVNESDILVTDTKHDRVLVIAPDGTMLWNSRFVEPFSDGSVLDYPNDATLLANGNLLISDMNNHRVLELGLGGKVHWQFGITGESGLDGIHLNNPHSPERLSNGNTLIADALNNRLVEVSPAGQLVWEIGPNLSNGYVLNSPRDIDLLANGDLAVAAFHNQDVLVIDRQGQIKRRLSFNLTPYDVDILANGNLLIGVGSILEFDSNDHVVWSYPPEKNIRYESFAVSNPASGVDIFGEIHLPGDASSTSQVPAIIMVPDAGEDGAGFHGICDVWARLGFAAIHFDPDGRGHSIGDGSYVNDDWSGFIHQDGLRRVFEMVASHQDIDSEQLVLRAVGHGLAMATGMLQRHPSPPRAAVLLDVEGHSTREQSSFENGGPVPVPEANGNFWAEREALGFIGQVDAAYLRLQSAEDSISPNNDYVIELLQRGLRSEFGGQSGRSSPQRVNGMLDNPTDFPWSLSTAPQWVDESIARSPWLQHREQMEVQNLLFAPKITVSGDLTVGGWIEIQLESRPRQGWNNARVALSAGVASIPMSGGGWSSLVEGKLFNLSATGLSLDPTGSASASWSIPAVSSLSGMTLFVQAVIQVGDGPVPYRLSPTEVFRIN